MKKTLSALLACLTIFTLLAGCANQGAKPTLRVYNWGDYIDESVLEMFETEFNCKVVYEVFDQNEDMYIKVKNSPGSYDVVIPSDYMIERMIKEDLLEKLNKQNVPNLEKINPACLSLNFDPQNDYSVPYMWGTVGIVYNSTMVTTEIDSWTDLWDPTYTKNLFMMDSVRDSMMIALVVLGYDMNTRELAEIEAAKNKLLEQRPLVLGLTGDEVKDKMVAGEAALAVMYSGDAVTVMDEDDGNPDLRYVIPIEGTNLWFDNMCVLKGTKNKELAEKFLNFMCRKDIATLNRDYINYLTPQTEVFEELPDEIKNDPNQYPSDEVLARCDVFYDLGEMAAVYDELWTKVKVN